MTQWTISIAMLASGALLGWLVGIQRTPEPPPNPTTSTLPPPESLLTNRETGWIDQWEDDLSTGRPFIIPGASASNGWDEDRKHLATLAYQDPETAITWIRKHLPEAEQSQRIRKEVIQPLMAVDFRKAIDLLPNLDLKARENSFYSYFWLFSGVPVKQLPDLATALVDLDDQNDIRYYRALPDFVKEWAKRDFNAAATWFESSDSGQPIHSDLTAIIEAARVRDGSIPDGLADKLGKASDRVASQILRDLYTASLKLPGDPAEHVQKVLALTPTFQQTGYATAFASNWAQADPLAASAWALSFEDTDFAVTLLESSLTDLLRYASEQAATWKSQQTPQNQARISKASVRALEQIKRRPPL